MTKNLLDIVGVGAKLGKHYKFSLVIELKSLRGRFFICKNKKPKKKLLPLSTRKTFFFIW